MAPYADSLLRFAHAATRCAPSRTETFTIGTRLTRITRELRLRDPEAALTAAGRAVPDWSGGTRLGDALKAFLDLWGQRGVARGAVVVLCSDGWERGDPTQLGDQLGRLARLAHKLVWVNPHKGRQGFCAHDRRHGGGTAASGSPRRRPLAGRVGAVGRGDRACVTCWSSWPSGGGPARRSGSPPWSAPGVPPRGNRARRCWSGRTAPRPAASAAVASKVRCTNWPPRCERASHPTLQRYGVSDDDAFAVGLTCGGIIDIFTEPIDPATLSRVRRGGGRHPGRATGGGGHHRRCARGAARPAPDHPARRQAAAAWVRPGSTTRCATTPAACWLRAGRQSSATAPRANAGSTTSGSSWPATPRGPG